MCRGVPLQYNLQLVENAVEAARGSGAQNKEEVRPSKQSGCWKVLPATTISTVVDLYVHPSIKLTSMAFQVDKWQVVAAYKKRGLKLATILYGRESGQAKRWRGKSLCEE